VTVYVNYIRILYDSCHQRQNCQTLPGVDKKLQKSQFKTVS